LQKRLKISLVRTISRRNAVRRYKTA